MRDPYVARETALGLLEGAYTTAYWQARDNGKRIGAAGEAGIHAVLDALTADPELAALTLRLERGVESRINTDTGNVEERAVLRYPWTETTGA